MAFCFNHLSLSGVINGTYREEHLEIPAKALREALVNALVHRLYVKRGSSVSLAIYDDRVEIINPGMFPSNLTMAELRAGNMSELRNPTIAKVMYSRKTVETWGRGIKLILDECAKANLPEPQIVAEGGYTRTVFMRPPAESEGGMKSGMKGGMRTADAIVAIIKENPQISINDIALRLSKARSAIIKQIARLKSAGILRRIGPDRGGHWEIVKG